jgi:high affinity Mn2+ porin
LRVELERLGVHRHAGASAGFSLSGNRWERKDDTVGLARQHETYFDLGGTGILVGDSKLPHPGSEKILETYYSLTASDALKLTADYQFIVDPAYNRDRGPVSVFGARVHAQF